MSALRTYRMKRSETGFYVISATQTGADRRYPFADEGYRREETARARLAKLREAEKASR